MRGENTESSAAERNSFTWISRPAVEVYGQILGKKSIVYYSAGPCS